MFSRPIVACGCQYHNPLIPGTFYTLQQTLLQFRLYPFQHTNRDIHNPYFLRMSLIVCNNILYCLTGILNFSVSVFIQNLTAPQIAPRCNSMNGSFPTGSYDSADMRSMSVIIIRLRTLSDIIPKSGNSPLQISMGRNSRIQHRHKNTLSENPLSVCSRRMNIF